MTATTTHRSQLSPRMSTQTRYTQFWVTGVLCLALLLLLLQPARAAPAGAPGGILAGAGARGPSAGGGMPATMAGPGEVGGRPAKALVVLQGLAARPPAAAAHAAVERAGATYTYAVAAAAAHVAAAKAMAACVAAAKSMAAFVAGAHATVAMAAFVPVVAAHVAAAKAMAVVPAAASGLRPLPFRLIHRAVGLLGGGGTCANQLTCSPDTLPRANACTCSWYLYRHSA